MMEAGRSGICEGDFEKSPGIEPTSPSMKPMTKPPMVKIAPTIVKTRTKMAPVLTLDLFPPFISIEPMIMTTPLTRPIPPTITSAVLTSDIPDTLGRELIVVVAAVTISPTIR